MEILLQLLKIDRIRSQTAQAALPILALASIGSLAQQRNNRETVCSANDRLCCEFALGAAMDGL